MVCILARLGVDNVHQDDTCHDEVGLCGYSMKTILESTSLTNERACVITKMEDNLYVGVFKCLGLDYGSKLQ